MPPKKKQLKWVDPEPFENSPLLEEGHESQDDKQVKSNNTTL